MKRDTHSHNAVFRCFLLRAHPFATLASTDLRGTVMVFLAVDLATYRIEGNLKVIV